MARRTKFALIDDLDGGDADVTVPFGLDGVLYEIDLSEDNAERMRARLAEFVGAARRVKRSDNANWGPAGKTTRHTERRRDWPPGRPERLTPELRVRIRAWAARKGVPLNPIGRFPDKVVNGYFHEIAARGSPP